MLAKLQTDLDFMSFAINVLFLLQDPIQVLPLRFVVVSPSLLWSVTASQALFFLTLTVLSTINHVPGRMPLNLCLSDVFLMIRLG